MGGCYNKYIYIYIYLEEGPLLGLSCHRLDLFFKLWAQIWSLGVLGGAPWLLCGLLFRALGPKWVTFGSHWGPLEGHLAHMLAPSEAFLDLLETLLAAMGPLVGSRGNLVTALGAPRAPQGAK